MLKASPWQRWMFGFPDRGDLVEPVGRESMIGMDGADHARLRKQVDRGLEPGEQQQRAHASGTAPWR